MMMIISYFDDLPEGEMCIRDRYEKIFDLLIEKASLEKIYEAADCIKE